MDEKPHPLIWALLGATANSAGHPIVALLFLGMWYADFAGHVDRWRGWLERRELRLLEDEMRKAGVVG